MIYNPYKIKANAAVGTTKFTWCLGNDGPISVLNEEELQLYCENVTMSVTELTILKLPEDEKGRTQFVLIEPNLGAVIVESDDCVVDGWRILRDDNQDPGPGYGKWGENMKVLF